MRISYQTMIRGLVTATLTAGVINAQAADNYPNRPVTIVTPTAAGGGTDIVARLTADKLGSLLGQPMVVNNKPGAGGAVGNQFMIREKNDGYSLFITANSNQLILPWVVQDAGFDPIKDYEPVAGLGSVPYVLAVHPEFEAQTLNEFLKVLKEKPGELYYASAGVGTLNHLIPEMLASELDSKMEHVPYRGVAPAMTDVIGGQVPILFGSLSSVLETIRSGKLKALAVTSEQRLDLLPDVPAISEEIPGFQAEMWIAMYAPAKTPDNVIQTLNDAIRTMQNDPDTLALFDKQGMQVMKVDSTELAKAQLDEYQRWKDIVKKSGATAQ